MRLYETETCYEYSENPKLLKEVLSEVKVYINKPTYRKYFADDTERRNVYIITITRGSKKLSFNFGDSLKNTQQGKKPRLYDILTTVGTEYFVPNTFNDFCDELGYERYNEYGRENTKYMSIFKKSQKMSQKLRRIFSEDEAMSMPR